MGYGRDYSILNITNGKMVDVLNALVSGVAGYVSAFTAVSAALVNVRSTNPLCVRLSNEEMLIVKDSKLLMNVIHSINDLFFRCWIVYWY
jgi:hypothetical protein